MQTTNYIINMTMIKIESYTDGTGEAANANLFGVDYDIPIFSPATVMNLIVNDTLKLNETIQAATGLSASEILTLSTTDSNIYLHRTNLDMNKVNLIEEHKQRQSEANKLCEGNIPAREECNDEELRNSGNRVHLINR